MNLKWKISLLVYALKGKKYQLKLKVKVGKLRYAIESNVQEKLNFSQNIQLSYLKLVILKEFSNRSQKGNIYFK